MRHARLVLVGLVIGNLITMLATVVGIALDFAPLVSIARHAIAVHIDTHHDHTGLAATASNIRHSLALDSITVDFHVITVHVDHRMVKAEHDIATKAA